MKPKQTQTVLKYCLPKKPWLALALSVDSVSGGLGAGLSGANILRVCLLSFIFGLMAVAAGGKLGEGLSKKGPDLSWVSGVFLIVLAAYKLIG